MNLTPFTLFAILAIAQPPFIPNIAVDEIIENIVAANMRTPPRPQPVPLNFSPVQRPRFGSGSNTPQVQMSPLALARSARTSPVRRLDFEYASVVNGVRVIRRMPIIEYAREVDFQTVGGVRITMAQNFFENHVKFVGNRQMQARLNTVILKKNIVWEEPTLVRGGRNVLYQFISHDRVPVEEFVLTDGVYDGTGMRQVFIKVNGIKVGDEYSFTHLQATSGTRDGFPVAPIVPLIAP